MERKLYTEGYELKDNEYLLKIEGYGTPSGGFLTKFNKDGTIPVAFQKWGNYPTEVPIYIHIEEAKRGWRLHKFRIGKSQNWAVLIHPDGFTVEIYLTNFLDILKKDVMRNCELEDSYKWESNKLIN